MAAWPLSSSLHMPSSAIQIRPKEVDLKWFKNMNKRFSKKKTLSFLPSKHIAAQHHLPRDVILNGAVFQISINLFQDIVQQSFNDVQTPVLKICSLFLLCSGSGIQKKFIVITSGCKDFPYRQKLWLESAEVTEEKRRGDEVNSPVFSTVLSAAMWQWMQEAFPSWGNVVVYHGVLCA